MNTELVRADAVKVGDRIRQADDTFLKVARIERGFYTAPSLMIYYTNSEWSHVLRTAKVERAAQ
jgi:hypothetical protein